MRLIVDQSLAAGFIPINTWQQRASLPFKPGVRQRKVYNMPFKPGVQERKVYNNDNITFFSVYKRLPSLSALMFSSTVSGFNTLSHSGLANVNTQKRMFYPLIKTIENKLMLTLFCTALPPQGT